MLEHIQDAKDRVRQMYDGASELQKGAAGLIVVATSILALQFLRRRSAIKRPLQNLESLSREQVELMQRTRADFFEVYEDDLHTLREIVTILNSPQNRDHFIYAPRTPLDLRKRIKQPPIKVFAGINELGEMFGTITAMDRDFPLNIHQMVHGAIREDLHRQSGKRSSDEPPGLGRQLFESALKYLFEESVTHEGRVREIIDLQIKIGPPGWEDMTRLAEGLGFRHINTESGVITVIDGKTEQKLPGAEYRLTRNDWLTNRMTTGFYQTI